MLTCLDLEGVLLPEIWIEFAKKTGIDELKKTTRDIPDYKKLMQMRLQILKKNNLKIHDIQDVIKTLKPLSGAKEFLAWLKSEFQVIILSDTFYEFSGPLMKQLDFPTLFCHQLVIDEKGTVINFLLRQDDQKTKAVKALQGLNFKVIAAGDSYNDTGMLQQADSGILFCPPINVIKEFPQFPVAKNYDDFQKLLLSAREKLLG
ncbi:bifunctional phosphoserine phosphatase/homoserine phosphotransferase ThrH [Nitrosomonadales bacterium]|nr:bifunctional phosphoserine phosphatase/homoserine phosphotransferase ThrH [Nitrosomonadales bacterium]|tara:strand:+ start:328 stop:939 length:612 start_codon:yes stop_codon:yes gene_type:complete